MNDSSEQEITILKPKDVKSLRDELLTVQEGRCLICGELIDGNKGRRACLDHDHVSGRIRGVLCSTCNVTEGAVTKSLAHRYAPRTSMGWVNPIQFLQRLLAYWQKEQHPYIHPTYSIELGKQKPIKRRRKRSK